MASCLKDQGDCLVAFTLVLVIFLYPITSFEYPGYMRLQVMPLFFLSETYSTPFASYESQFDHILLIGVWMNLFGFTV